MKRHAWLKRGCLSVVDQRIAASICVPIANLMPRGPLAAWDRDFDRCVLAGLQGIHEVIRSIREGAPPSLTFLIENLMCQRLTEYGFSRNAIGVVLKMQPFTVMYRQRIAGNPSELERWIDAAIAALEHPPETKWVKMLEAGYTIREVDQATGVSRRKIERLAKTLRSQRASR